MECSTGWDGLSSYGSAATASFWVAIEQPGPWGRDALTESHLDPDLGAGLAAESSAAGGRVLLIRRAGPHADRFQSRRVFVAGGLAGGGWLLSGAVLNPAVTAGLPWHLLADPTADAVLAACSWLQPVAQPVLLVCANSRRDVCCALRGRPVAVDAAARRPGQVWECSHTGGHRFAATGVVLPTGQCLARLTGDLAVEALDAAAAGRLASGSLGERHDRGRSHLPPAAMAAESWVRAETGDVDPTSLRAEIVSEDADAATVRVSRRDGVEWTLHARLSVGEPLPESCGKAAVPSRTWAVTSVGVSPRPRP